VTDALDNIGFGAKHRALIEGLEPLRAQMAGLEPLRAQMAGFEVVRAQAAGLSTLREAVGGFSGSIASDALQGIRPQLATGIAQGDVQRAIHAVSGSLAASDHLREAVAGLSGQFNDAALAGITKSLRVVIDYGPAVADSAADLADEVVVAGAAVESDANTSLTIAAWLAVLPLRKQLDLLLTALTVMEAFGLLLESASKDADIPDPIQAATAMAMAIAWLLLAVLQARESD
jgi:hypothetical protein